MPPRWRWRDSPGPWDAKGDDPLAPVTVVAPSGYAAVFVRRTLGTWSGTAGRRGWANIDCTTVTALIRMLGAPALATRGLRLASPAVDLEVIRSQAKTSSDRLGQFASHPSALTELQRALVELRGCPPATIEAISHHGGQGAELVALLRAVRHRLHENGLADVTDPRAEAIQMAREHPSSLQALGPLVTWKLGPRDPAERELLGILGARGIDETVTTHGAATLTEIRPGADPDEEARTAVRSVIAAAEAGVPLWHQAVLHPPGPTYARILHQHLTAAGVASNGPDMRRLHRSMTGRALLGLLELAGGDWPRDQVLAWLSAGPVTVGPSGRPVPASRWDVVSAAAGVVRGPEQWQERLGRVAGHGGPSADEAAALATSSATSSTGPRRRTPRGVRSVAGPSACSITTSPRRRVRPLAEGREGRRPAGPSRRVDFGTSTGCRTASISPSFRAPPGRSSKGPSSTPANSQTVGSVTASSSRGARGLHLPHRRHHRAGRRPRPRRGIR